MNAKLLGRLGWRGQCTCRDCGAGPRDKKAIRAEEKREVRRMVVEAVGERAGTLRP